MIKKLALIGVTAAGVALLAAPAHADTRIDNDSRNSRSAQPGHNLSNSGASDRGGQRATDVTNINGTAVVAPHRGWAPVAIEVDQPVDGARAARGRGRYHRRMVLC